MLTVGSVKAIWEKVNSEYGTDLEIPRQTLSRNSNQDERLEGVISEKSINDIELTPEILAQFEKEVADFAEFMADENKKAEESWNNVLKLEENSDILKQTSRLRHVKSGYKSFTGAPRVYFEGWVNNNAGHWKWEYMNVIRVNPSDSTPYRFYLEKTDHNFYDARRTCAVNYIGTMYKNTILGWIPSSSTQYLEWYA